MFLAVERRPGANVPERWWEQEGLVWEESRETERGDEAGEDGEEDKHGD